MSITAVGHRYGVNEWTICCIKKNEDKVRESIKVSAPGSEKLLYVFVIFSSKRWTGPRLFG
jgi:hypothetical protein